MGLFTTQASLFSPMGWITITEENNFIISISFTNEEINNGTPTNVLIDAMTQLQEYFSNKRTSFTFPVNPAGTSFQQKVWEELRNIPFGKTTSYSALATKLGDLKAIRAVASANGANPLMIVVPCHRVIGQDGSLTGYAAGLERKAWLLNHEKGVYTPTLFQDEANVVTVRSN